MQFSVEVIEGCNSSICQKTKIKEKKRKKKEETRLKEKKKRRYQKGSKRISKPRL